MPDAKQSYRPRYNHRHSTPRLARTGCLQRSDHTCQGCGLMPATEAHHWTYPPEEETTADHLTGFCESCHDIITWFTWFISFGGSHELFRELLPAFLARVLECPERPEHRRIGRPRRVGNAWGAVVSGGSRPLAGEVVALLLRCSGEWRDYVVREVVDGRPGSWQVLTRPLSKRDEVRPLCISDLGRRFDPR